MKALSTAAALAVLASAAVTAQTQEQPSPPSHSMSNASPGSYQSSASCEVKRQAIKDAVASTAFASTAAQDGMVEVAIAGMALQKSSNHQVRQFAQQMIQDYAQSNGDLDSIVRCEGLILPTGLDTKHNALVNSFHAKSGSAFDTAYLTHIVQKHSAAVALFESASRSSDADMAAFARKELSTLHAHLLLADNLRANGSANVAAGTH